MKHKLIIVIFLMIVLCGKAEAITRYVNPACTNGIIVGIGTSACTGGSDTVHDTIQHAADVVNPDDIVIVKDGIYTDTDSSTDIVHINRAGTSGHWIIFKAENKWGAKLNGQNNTTSFGIYLDTSAAYIKIQDFEIYGCKDVGVGAPTNANHIEISGNNFHDLGRQCTNNAYGQGVAIFTGRYGDVSYFTIDRNLVHDNGRYMYGENGCSYADSGLDNAMYLNGSNAIVTNNIWYNNKSGDPLVIKGSYCSTCGKHYKVINNTFGQLTHNAMILGDIVLVGADSGLTGTVDDIEIDNNIFASSEAFGIMCWSNYGTYCGSGSTDITNVIIKNNITKTSALIFNWIGDPYTNIQFTISGNSVVTDPLFVNYSGYDFHLLSTSPAINAGIATNAPALDYASIARPQGSLFDIGAYEYVYSPPFAQSSLYGGASLKYGAEMRNGIQIASLLLLENNDYLLLENGGKIDEE
jgi:hypothetical protein